MKLSNIFNRKKMKADLTKIVRNVGDFVTPVAEKLDEQNLTKVQHRFKKGNKLMIQALAKVDDSDGTKNYWCVNEKGMELLNDENVAIQALSETGLRQLMNEKEIIDYKP